MIILIILFVIVIAVWLYLQQPMFGAFAKDKALEKIKASPNYRNGQFQNKSLTPNFTNGASFFSVLKEFIFEKDKRNKPSGSLPSAKTNLLTLDPAENVLVWMGHSSYYMQLDGKKILVDPVLSGAASPIRFTTRSFSGSDIYTVDEIPAIDYLFISHDHWDHLDYDTLIKLKGRVGLIITSIGTGAHLKRWGYDGDIIIEKDWYETEILPAGFVVNVVPARHFSGRTFKRNQSLWLSFVLTTPAHKIFIGGDSGYDAHFKEAGDQFGPFDLAILECGQYNQSWKHIHMMPEDMVQAAIDLKAKKVLPVHWAKFALGLHAWDEPIIRATVAAKIKNMRLLTPMIGHAVYFDNAAQNFTDWWTQGS